MRNDSKARSGNAPGLGFLETGRGGAGESAFTIPAKHDKVKILCFQHEKQARLRGKPPGQRLNTTRQTSRGRKGCTYNGTERKDP
uniref:Uncharacterized protein n=1 Tax=Siphoviridae sp. ct3es5 TaxID=2825322 RepID=A0A8S5PTE7_9CAUD|nr:MAG TPA: hypothetical protein [Siphoviridae sp. ct3es5]